VVSHVLVEATRVVSSPAFSGLVIAIQTIRDVGSTILWDHAADVMAKRMFACFVN